MNIKNLQYKACRGKPSGAMRNLVAHNYGSMSREIIWETATHDIASLKKFCENQLKSEIE